MIFRATVVAFLMPALVFIPFDAFTLRVVLLRLGYTSICKKAVC